MDFKQVERVVKAVAADYGFKRWQDLFSAPDQKGAFMCGEVLAKMPLYTVESAAQVLGLDIKLFRKFIASERTNADYEYSREHYSRIERILCSMDPRRLA